MRKMRRTMMFLQVLVWALVMTTLVTGVFPPEVQAMLAPPSATASESGTGLDRAADLQKVQNVLETKVVSQRLADYGLSQEEISARVNRLSDAHLHQLATQIVVALLVIAILAVILVYLLGHRIAITKA